jgi:uncharacterized protein YbjQ (UPF0145 family)
VRSRNIASQVGSGLRSIFGRELKGMTTVLGDSRQEAIARLKEEEIARGANAIIAMRFDASDLGSVWTEICAYGTAVHVSKV